MAKKKNHYNKIGEEIDTLIGNYGAENVSHLLESINKDKANGKQYIMMNFLNFIISKLYNISTEDMWNSKSDNCSEARMLCLFILYQEFTMSMNSLGNLTNTHRYSVGRYVKAMEGYLENPELHFKICDTYSTILERVSNMKDTFINKIK